MRKTIETRLARLEEARRARAARPLVSEIIVIVPPGLDIPANPPARPGVIKLTYERGTNESHYTEDD